MYHSDLNKDANGEFYPPQRLSARRFFIIYPSYFKMRDFNAQLARNLNVLIEKKRRNSYSISSFFD